ncbi:FecR family protein [Comamonas terrigena]|uniref:FecR family protein n=1 Tax=Comamonas terrigena TaxID=32013 RepID=UPI00244C1207|nr:FecR domain-containing protein [Comamonas terrigena]MDH1703149.1 FecR domain-containing protein [Comamonas terrigena]
MREHSLSSREAAAQDDADAREFEEYARTQDPVLLEAALWATRRSGGLDAAGEAEFQGWLHAHPAHPRVWAEMDASLDPVQRLPENQVQQLKAGLSAPALPSTPSPSTPSPAAPRAGRPASPGRRSWLAGIGHFFPQAATAMAVVALVGGGWMGWDHYRAQPTFAKDYATARGQHLSVELPDGSTLQLDAATQAQVRLYRDRREVQLLEGQAMFAVAANPEQPFNVEAGPVQVTVVGTRFSVRHVHSGMDADSTVVAVESGRVRVARAAPAAPVEGPARAAEAERVELTAGQSVTADPSGHLQSVVDIAPGNVAGWRQGRISFNDVPLSDALMELERYGDTGLVVRDPSVAAMRLGGSVNLRQVGVFAQALPSLLPVRLEKRDGQVEILPVR